MSAWTAPCDPSNAPGGLALYQERLRSVTRRAPRSSHRTRRAPRPLPWCTSLVGLLALIVTVASREEAEEWLKTAEAPPSPARILIGDEYHQCWYTPEDNTRGMYRDYAMEPALEVLTARGIPPGTPSFATRAEAEEWLMSHPATPYAFVLIAGEPHFAVHHRKLKRH